LAGSAARRSVSGAGRDRRHPAGLGAQAPCGGSKRQPARLPPGRLQRLAVAPLFVFSIPLLLGLPLDPSLADSPWAGNLVAELEMHPSKDGIFAPIRIDGQDYLFLLDTGANLTVLDIRFRPLPGAPIGRRWIATPEGEQPIEGYAPIELRLESLDASDGSSYLTSDFDPVRQVTGIPVYGIKLMRRFASRVAEDFRIRRRSDCRGRRRPSARSGRSRSLRRPWPSSILNNYNWNFVP
jgi:hypothetical protein